MEDYISSKLGNISETKEYAFYLLFFIPFNSIHDIQIQKGRKTNRYRQTLPSSWRDQSKKSSRIIRM